ncbi:MAG: hypothetical protein ABEI74_03325 [Candidatus Pacearchaeota archaeon]
MEKSGKSGDYRVGISGDGLLKESLEFKLEVYRDIQSLNTKESIIDYKADKSYFSETLRKNAIYCDRIELVDRIKSNWYDVSPRYKTDQQIRNENLGGELRD